MLSMCKVFPALSAEPEPHRSEMLHHCYTNKRYRVKIKGKKKIQSLHVISIKAKEKLFMFVMFCLLCSLFFFRPLIFLSFPFFSQNIAIVGLKTLSLLHSAFRFKRFRLCKQSFALTKLIPEAVQPGEDFFEVTVTDSVLFEIQRWERKKIVQFRLTCSFFLVCVWVELRQKDLSL